MSDRRRPASRFKRRLFALTNLLVAICALSVGCQSELESGYKPRSLNAGPAQRRAYYASPFTPEAEAGGKEKGPDVKAFRAGGG